MRAGELATRAENVARNYKTAYVWGAFGWPITEEKIARSLKEYDKNSKYEPGARALLGKGAFMFDCVGLIKAILWGWCGGFSKSYGGAVYPTTSAVLAGACPDIGADTMISVCSEVSTDFSRIVPGAVVWLSGHIGIYIGGGLAVECTPKWSGGVQVTAVSNIGARAGYNARRWTKWGKIPYVDYEEEPEMNKEELRGLIREVVLEVLDEVNPVYKDLKDVPAYWQGAAAALLDAGAVNGGTPAEVCATDLNLRKETLKAAVVGVLYHEARERVGE